uniref:Uncharacterized protein n=1 Tax=Arundo donax TaxID=35708 RepID=A0A0A9CAV4_ARUDO
MTFSLGRLGLHQIMVHLMDQDLAQSRLIQTAPTWASS